MVIDDHNLRAKIIERLQKRSTDLNELHAARKRIENEKLALADAEREVRREDIYRHLISIGTCLGVINEPREALKYFLRAAEEFPDKRYPLWIIVMTLTHLGEKDEAAKYAELYEKRFPPK